jgi:hypothetical protein
MTETITLRAVVNKLVERRLLLSNVKAKITQTITVPVTERPIPWYINAFMGISAWLSTLLFLGFSFLVHLVETPLSAIAVGSVLVISTILLHLYQRETLFLNQLFLALNLTGQVLFIGGTVLETDLGTAALVTLVLATLQLWVYQDSIHRFLTVLIGMGALLLLLYDLEIYQGIHVLIFGIAAGAAWCWLDEPYHLTDRTLSTLYHPLGYGLVVAMQLILVLSILPHLYYVPPVNWRYTTIGLTMLLLAMEYQILRAHQMTFFSPTNYLILAGTLLIAVLLYQSPGIIAAIIVMLLGFQRSSRVLMGLALTFLVVFIAAYYYHLNITLLLKSLMLMSSGLALLGLRLLLKRVFPLPEGGT